MPEQASGVAPAPREGNDLERNGLVATSSSDRRRPLRIRRSLDGDVAVSVLPDDD